MSAAFCRRICPTCSASCESENSSSETVWKWRSDPSVLQVIDACACGGVLHTKNTKQRHRNVCPLLELNNNNIARSKVIMVWLNLDFGIWNSSFKTVLLIGKCMALVGSWDWSCGPFYPCDDWAMGETFYWVGNCDIFILVMTCHEYQLHPRHFVMRLYSELVD